MAVISTLRRQVNEVRASLPHVREPVPADVVISYDLEWSSFFVGGVWAPLFSVKNIGNWGPYRGQTIFDFDPADYGINDAGVFWVRAREVKAAGPEPFDDPVAVIPHQGSTLQPFIFKGIVPAGADLQTGGTTLRLPRSVEVHRFIVEAGTAALAFAWVPDSSGGELFVPPGECFEIVSRNSGMTSTVYMRGVGGDSTVVTNPLLRSA